MEPPAPNLGEAVAFFEQMLQQLEGVHQRLPEGPERTQVQEVLKDLRGPMQALGKAGEEAQAELAALKQKTEDQLKKFALPKAETPLAAEAGATLGLRLREEILRRYPRRKFAPVTQPVLDEDLISDNVGSIASQWSWDSNTSDASAPLAPPPPPPAPATPPPGSPLRATTKRKKDDSDVWDDLSRAEE
jgi:hypothetical protein